MQFSLVVALLLALCASLFAIQNVAPVTISFFLWTFEGSLAIILFITLLAGACASLLASAPGIVRHRWQANQLRKQVAELEQRLAERDQVGKATPSLPPVPDAKAPGGA